MSLDIKAALTFLVEEQIFAADLYHNEELPFNVCLRLSQPFTGRSLPVRSVKVSRSGRQAQSIVAAATTVQKVTRKPVPLKLEEGELPMNTFNNKKTFTGKIRSVERIVGPKATGETCHIIIETEGKIPFWEGQSYGVIPPVSALLIY